MKSLLLSTACASGILLSSSASGSLILTGLVDGPLSGGTPKALELYVTADVADLSVYWLEAVFNAGSPTGVEANGFTLSGSATAGSYLYLATEATNFTAVFGFAPTFTTGEVNHNGDDDFYLYGPGPGPSTIVIDVWSDSPGIDNSGTVSDILDSWAYRKDGTGPSATFVPGDWTIAAVDSLDGLDAAGTATAVPFGTFAVPEPTAALLGGIGLFSLLVRRRA